MDNSLNLISGRRYQVKKKFTDFDSIVHEIGETWVYQGTNFLPYEDGLTLHVLLNNKATVYRPQWRRDEQADIIENFSDYVEPY